ncbi:MAG: DRTGG domain-containing protein [Clostridia bacterium]
MKASEVASVLGAKVICGQKFLDEIEVDWAFGADMMSDVLAFVCERTLFLTGMLNAHAIRTAEIMDIRCIVFVRGKQVTDEIKELAEERDMVILGTEKTMFTSCGQLYEAGLRGCPQK